MLRQRKYKQENKSKKQHSGMSKKEQEYRRLNDELIMRINRSYNDGVMLASFFLIYYATSFAAFVQFVSQGVENNLLKFIVFGLISTIAFSMPSVLLYAFSIKHKENFISICNISGYIKIYHELPTLSNKFNDEGEIKWEVAHRDTISPSARQEDKEYFFLSLVSLVLMIASASVTFYLSFGNKESLITMIIIDTISLCGVVVGIIFTVKTRNTTNLNKLVNEIKNSKKFYRSQSKISKKYSMKGEAISKKYEYFKKGGRANSIRRKFTFV